MLVILLEFSCLAQISHVLYSTHSGEAIFMCVHFCLLLFPPAGSWTSMSNLYLLFWVSLVYRSLLFIPYCLLCLSYPTLDPPWVKSRAPMTSTLPYCHRVRPQSHRTDKCNYYIRRYRTQLITLLCSLPSQ